jgi:hypothetical protein
MKKAIAILALAAASIMANGRDSGINYCVSLGQNNTTTNVTLADANKYCITQFPEWSYGKVRINIAPTNGSFTGAVVINGQVNYLTDVWYKSFEIVQSSSEPVSVIIDNDNANPVNLGVQWWVEQ